MKIDLDDLERDTTIAEAQDRNTLELLRGDGVPLEETAFRRGYSARSPTVILALIARIRELEGALGTTLGRLNDVAAAWIPGARSADQDPLWRAQQAILDKGAVLK